MISERMKKVETSATAVVAARIEEMRSQGMEIISFNLGEPDFDTPEKITRAGMDAMQKGYTRYAPVAGILPLKQAISEKLKKENHLEYEPSQICISTGAKQAIYNAVMAVCGEGDEVLIPTPCWVSYEEMAKLAGATPVLIPSAPGYRLDLNAIRGAITPRTKLIMINTPNNPTGVCYSREELEELASFAVEHDFYIISDEVYEKLIFGKEHVSVGSISREALEHTITVNGFSKAFAMTGWRLGYSAAPIDVAKAIVAVQSNCTTGSTTFVQHAGLEALASCSEDVEKMRLEFEKRRDYAYERLSSMKGITCTKPDGAFYFMPDVSAYFGKTGNGREIKNAFDFFEYILEEAKVAVVPGDAFEMPGTVRLAYPVSMESLKEGLDRFEAALEKLNGKLNGDGEFGHF